VSYGGVQGLEIAARVRVRSTIKPEGIRGRTRVWYSKVRHGVCIPLPIHAGRSLLWHLKIRSRTWFSCGSDSSVVQRGLTLMRRPPMDHLYVD
jgi:hypothetical protein